MMEENLVLLMVMLIGVMISIVKYGNKMGMVYHLIGIFIVAFAGYGLVGLGAPWHDFPFIMLIVLVEIFGVVRIVEEY